MTININDSVVYEGIAKQSLLFLNDNIKYILWITSNDGLLDNIQWQSYDDGGNTKILGKLNHHFNHVTCQCSNNTLVVCWDYLNRIYLARFNLTTGDLLQDPYPISFGNHPELKFQDNDEEKLLVLAFCNKTAYLKISTDLGFTWSDDKPILNNGISQTNSIKLVPYLDKNFNVIQRGKDSKELKAEKSFLHSRPLSGVIEDPNNKNQIIVSETSNYSGNSNLYGGLYADSNNVYVLEGLRQGTDDNLGSTIILNKENLSVVDSFGPQATSSSILSKYTSSGTFISSVSFNGNGNSLKYDNLRYLFTIDTDNEYDLVNPIDKFRMYKLISIVPDATYENINAIYVLNSNLIIIAYTNNGGDYISIYTNNCYPGYTEGTTQSKLIKTFITSNTVNCLYCEYVDKTIYIYAGTINGISKYKFTDPQWVTTNNNPVLLVNTYLNPSKPDIFYINKSQNGNLICGYRSGILIFNESGEVIAQLTLNTNIEEWIENKDYSVGDLIIPRRTGNYGLYNWVFTCSTAGKSNRFEPDWNTESEITDNTAKWTYRNVADTCITNLVIDNDNEYIYATGINDGINGVTGITYRIKATGLLSTKLDIPELSYTIDSNYVVTLDWNTTPTTDYYIIQRYIEGCSDWETLEPVTGNTYNDPITGNLKVKYRVKAHNDVIDLFSMNSNEVFVDTTIPNLGIPPEVESDTMHLWRCDNNDTESLIYDQSNVKYPVNISTNSALTKKEIGGPFGYYRNIFANGSNKGKTVSYCSTAELNDLMGDMTYEIWLYVDSSSPSNNKTVLAAQNGTTRQQGINLRNQATYSLDDPYGYFANSTGSLSYYYSNCYIARDVWNHIALTRKINSSNSITLSFYINGVYQGSGNLNSSVFDISTLTTYNWFIANWFSGTTNAFYGGYCQVKASSSVKSAEYFKDNYYKAIGKYPYNYKPDAFVDSYTKVHLKLDETSGNLINSGSLGGYFYSYDSNYPPEYGVAGRTGDPNDKALKFTNIGKPDGYYMGIVSNDTIHNFNPLSYSISFWTYIYSINNANVYKVIMQRCLSGDTSIFRISQTTGGNIYFNFRDVNNAITNSFSIPVRMGFWNLISFTYDDEKNEIRIYVNGILRKVLFMKLRAFQTLNDQTRWQVGGGYYPNIIAGTGTTPNCLIDDVRIEDIVRSENFYRLMYEDY